MRIKILLAGNNATRIKFLKSLEQDVTFKQANGSLCVVGTGTYTFRLGNDDIEIMYIEDSPSLRSNYARYAKNAKGIIFVDADEETQKLLREACPKHTPVAKNYPGKEIRGITGVNIVVKKCYQRQMQLSGNPATTFTKRQPASSSAKQAQTLTAEQSNSLDLLKKFLAERSPALK